MLRSTSACSGAVLLLFVTACGGGDRTIVDPPPPPPAGDVILTLAAHQDDAAVAQALGWTAGIPAAEVRLGDGRTFTTSETGTLTIPGFRSGQMQVSIRRFLTAGEQSAAAASGAFAFVSDGPIDVPAGATTATVRVPVSYRRSLVISEFSGTPRLLLGVGHYHFGGFIELYNNSDTTLYLDGILLASTIPVSADVNPNFPCTLMDLFQNDPAAAWSPYMAAFPGSGQSYPLAPGKTVVVAVDAIDHRDLFPGMLDLRGADFEFIGFSDVDNPAVTNMIDRSTRQHSGMAHGLLWNAVLAAGVAVVGRVDPTALEIARLPGFDADYRRLAKEQLLDFLTLMSTYYSQQQPPTVECPRLVHSSIDRQHAYLLIENPDDYAVSQSRKVLATLPDGRHVLQHTRNSAADFRNTSRTPGVIVP